MLGSLVTVIMLHNEEAVLGATHFPVTVLAPHHLLHRDVTRCHGDVCDGVAVDNVSRYANARCGEWFGGGRLAAVREHTVHVRGHKVEGRAL